MTRTLLLLFGSLLLGLPVAAAAQNTAAPANVVTPAPAPREGTVGPEQLRDFALPGTRQPAPATEPTPRAAPAPAPPPAQRPATPAINERPAPSAPARSETATERSDPPVDATPTRVAPTASSIPAPSVPAVETAPPLLPVPQQEQPVSTPIEAVPSGGQLSSALPVWWPWLLVAAVGGIALALVLRQRRKPAVAGPAETMFEGVSPSLREPAAPRPPTPPQPPNPAPTPPLPTGMVTTRLRQSPSPAQSQPSPTPPPTPQPVAGGIVSRRLRGWVTIDVAVREILFSAEDAVLRVDLVIGNEGTGSARDIALEALAINAGDDQADGIEAFFARPAARVAAIAELGPHRDTVINHEIRVPRVAIRIYEAGGRALFVPVLLFNAAYRTAAGEGRSSAAFLVGRHNPGSAKLAPLVLPEGAGRATGLDVRRLDQAVRR